MDLFDDINFGLENLGLAEHAAEDAEFQDRLQTLQDRMQTIEETGLVSRDQVQQLIVSGVPVNERRFPLASFTIEPSPVNIRPALEAAGVEQRSLLTKMIEAANAAFRKLLAWIQETVKKIRDAVNGAIGKMRVKFVKQAPEYLPPMNRMITDLPKELARFDTKAGNSEKAGKARNKINDAWNKFVERDKAAAEKFFENPLMNSSVLTDLQVRTNYLALVQAMPMLVKQMLDGAHTASARLAKEVKPGMSAEEKAGVIEPIIEALRRSQYHPLTTRLGATSGLESGEATISLVIKQFISDMLKAGTTAGTRVSWERLDARLLSVIEELAPYAHDTSSTRVSINKIATTMSKAELEMAMVVVDDRETVSRVTQAYNQCLIAMNEVQAVEMRMSTLMIWVGSALKDRASHFHVTLTIIGEQYTELGIGKEFKDYTKPVMEKIESITRQF